ncbi:Clp protease N-terminal domain-containing protein [Streptomyces sp. TLI_171]|uniref:Clp protease N-terminal domain-containing protein n=1 Tax=Streptomyces sp. TLI_171 TaxID=1938859 RepID=UPI0015D529C8|nr:Clp protease N-terminal domain-containing protein [Streptomyces sp. TLI_171]
MPTTPGSARRTVVDLAKKEAWERKHTQTDTGHLLLAVLAVADEQVAAELAAQGITAEQIRDMVEDRWAAGLTDGKPWRFLVPYGEMPPFSFQAGEAIEQATLASGDDPVRPVAVLSAITSGSTLAATVLRTLRALDAKPGNITR